jgi:hypothetical protein
MPLSQDQLVGLTKQVFMLEYLINGLFPCQSDVVRLIRAKKREWKFNDKFEYRMLLATTNTGGTLNSQVFKENVSLVKPGNLEYGTYRATYGTVSDGFDVDMMLNLETKEKQASFENDYATRMHSLRTNVAALFKNFAIHGKYGVVHQIRASILAPTVPASRNPQPNVFTPVLGTPFTIKAPINVYNSNFKTGKLLIKTTEVSPAGAANVAELYLVLDNQPGTLSLLPCGTAVSDWDDGQFLEVAQNREIVGMPATVFQSWNYGAITVASGPFAGTYDQFAGTGAYTSGASSIVGAMEGLADLFPWYTDPADPDTRLTLDMPFRDQASRLQYSTEQAGGWITQLPGEHIIDAIMRGAFLTKSTVPYAEIGIWINPMTRMQMGYEEGGNVKVLRDNFIAGPIVYQRGVKSTDYQIGNQVVKEVVEDLNMPTDVIIIGPKNDISYNCWDNSIFQIDDYIQETWSKKQPPAIEEIAIPDEFMSKLDLSNRITFGSPTLTDGGLANFANGNGFRHPKNRLPIALHEMGALFTEYPYTYTVVKLLDPIADLTTV